MNHSENWWETVFEGTLEVGINKEKLTDIEEESFLYFNAESPMQEQQL
ncbi:hypothetical protein [Indiicoccus explosivorum]|nr:hypothetical protein [Indiicoccus explosivorum]